MISSTHVPSSIGQLGPLCADGLGLCPSPTDGEPLGVIAFPPYDLGEDSSSGINKPVANLQNGEACFFGEGKLLGIAWICIVSVVIQPLLQDLNGVFG